MVAKAAEYVVSSAILEPSGCILMGTEYKNKHPCALINPDPSAIASLTAPKFAMAH